jgi:hypothetical protein
LQRTIISFQPAVPSTTNLVSCNLGGVISPPEPDEVHGSSKASGVARLVDRSLLLVPIPHPTRISNISANKKRNPKK